MLVGAAVLAGQASIGWCNDWLDADRDRAVGRPDKPVVQGAVTPGAAAHGGAGRGRRSPSSSRCCSGVVPGLLLLGPRRQRAGPTTPGLKRTALSPLPYLTGFGALPAGVVAAAPGTPVAPWWLVAAGAALGGAAHVANVAPDVDDDLATGVRGCRTGSGRCASAVAGAVLLGTASLLLVLGPAGPAERARLGGAACSPPPPSSSPPWPAAARARRLAFPAVMLLTVLDVVLLLAGGAALT